MAKFLILFDFRPGSRLAGGDGESMAAAGEVKQYRPAAIG